MKKIFNVAAFVCGMDEEYPYQIIKGINEFARNHAINISYFASFGGVVENSSFDDGEYSIYKLAQLASFDGALLLTNTFSNLDMEFCFFAKPVTDFPHFSVIVHSTAILKSIHE